MEAFVEEQGKIILYKQLMKFEEMGKIKPSKLIVWDDFLHLNDKDILVYSSDFRDMCSEAFNKIAKVSERRPLYLELPDINLER